MLVVVVAEGKAGIKGGECGLGKRVVDGLETSGVGLASVVGKGGSTGRLSPVE